jgi:virulence factor Mce-like protein
MNLRREARWLWPIGVIVVVALVCGAYILNKQRLESPLAERLTINLEFDQVDAVTPGLGNPVTVAGVAVGQIVDSTLEDGRGVVKVSIDPKKLPHVYADAAASLIPNTPLKDMQIRLYPGRQKSRPLSNGATVSIAETTTPVDSDELLRALDSDTRTWVQVLMADLGAGLKGRGRDLNSVLKTLGPTAAQTRRITSLLAERRRELPKLVHNLSVITKATASSDRELAQVVDAGNATLEALATNADPLKESLELLPGTLAAARSTLERTAPFAQSLDRALTGIDPALAALPETLRGTPGAARGLVPLPAKQLGEFIDGIAPLTKYVRPAGRDLAAARPGLEKAFGALRRTTNALAYTPDKNHKSYLFWLGWFNHNVNSTLSAGDAHGTAARGYAMFSCGTFDGPPELAEVLEALTGASGVCPEPAP